MERISISLPPPLMTWLKQEAKRRGISVGELLRRIIDHSIWKQPKEQRRG